MFIAVLIQETAIRDEQKLCTHHTAMKANVVRTAPRAKYGAACGAEPEMLSETRAVSSAVSHFTWQPRKASPSWASMKQSSHVSNSSRQVPQSHALMASHSPSSINPHDVYVVVSNISDMLLSCCDSLKRVNRIGLCIRLRQKKRKVGWWRLITPSRPNLQRMRRNSLLGPESVRWQSNLDSHLPLLCTFLRPCWLEYSLV